MAGRGRVSRAVIRALAWVVLATLTPNLLLVDELPARVARGGKPSLVRPVREPTRRRPGRPYHPDPRIVIDVIDALGATSVDLQRTARDLGYWPFRRCYEDGLRRDQGLAGKVSLELSIAPSGHVERANVTASTLRDRIVAACLAREARQISFSTVESETRASADVTLGAGDEPVATSLPVAGAEELRRSLRAEWPAAEACYSRALTRDPRVGGLIELVFHVDTHGAITEVSEGSTHLVDAELSACIVDVYRGARLPPDDPPRERSFLYALHLEAEPTPIAPEPP